MISLSQFAGMKICHTGDTRSGRKTIIQRSASQCMETRRRPCRLPGWFVPISTDHHPAESDSLAFIVESTTNFKQPSKERS